MMADGEDSAGVGFGSSSNEQAEERGRKALDAMRAASSDGKGYDSSLQGLQARPEDEPVEVPQEFKSTV